MQVAMLDGAVMVLMDTAGSDATRAALGRAAGTAGVQGNGGICGSNDGDGEALQGKDFGNIVGHRGGLFKDVGFIS